MRNIIGTNARDAELARRHARKDGEGDGRHNYPPQAPGVTTTSDYASGAHTSEANTTDALTKGAHFNEQRVEDDERLAKARSETGRYTALTKDVREDYEDALAELRAYEQKLPLSAKFGFWPKWVVYGLLVLLAFGSGAAVTAALLQVTSDQNLLTWVIGASVAIATVVGGAALGTLLRRRDLDTIQRGKYSSSGRYSTGVLLLGLVGILSLATGVAGLRHAASEADAARRANSTKVTLLIPGQQPTAEAPTSGSKHSGRHGVDWTIWFAFELGFAAAATSIEFQRSDVRAEHKEQLARGAKAKHEQWRTTHRGLAGAIAEQESSLAARADHDLAIILTGSAQRSFADVLNNEYRHGNLAQRAQGGDPFEKCTAPNRMSIETAFDGKPGIDAFALASAGKVDDPATVAQLVRSNRDLGLLQNAYDELGRSPGRPRRSDNEPWTPGAYLDLDPAAVALRGSTARAVPDPGVNTIDAAQPAVAAPTHTGATVPDFPQSSANGGVS